MIKKLFKRFKRAPVPAVAILLFAAIISVIICALQASNEAELRNYEELYQSIPITMTVTGSTGQNLDQVATSSWVSDLFTGEQPVEILCEDYNEKFIEVSLAEYVKDVKVSMLHNISTINGIKYTSAAGTSFLIGMNSVSCDKRLLPEYGCEIKWYEGYDESIFEGDELVCLVPEKMAKPRYYDNGKGEAVLFFKAKSEPTFTYVNGEVVSERRDTEYQCTLKIVGTYSAGDMISIYCPLPLIEHVCSGLETDPRVLSLSATLADNRRLEEFREKASMFFIEPSPDAEETPWGLTMLNRSVRYCFTYYSNALDIDEVNLDNISYILENSIKLNRTVTLIVVALSAVAGFLVGFLMVRRRKRDILLMRIVGESNAKVYIGFALEQMICILLGIAFGGAYYNWNPIKNLAIFAAVYFVALSLALAIFLNSKLLTAVKEDE